MLYINSIRYTAAVSFVTCVIIILQICFASINIDCITFTVIIYNIYFEFSTKLYYPYDTLIIIFNVAQSVFKILI